MDIKQALGYLDPNDDMQWTGEGLPLVDAVSNIAGRPVKRQEIIDAAPGFNRSVAYELLEEQTGSGEADAAGEVDPAEEVIGEGEGGEPTLEDSPPEPHVSAEPEQPSVLGMKVIDVLRDLPMCQRAVQELESKMLDAAKRKKAIDAEIAGYNSLLQVYSAHIERNTKANPQAAQQPILDYLNKQTELRAEKAKAIKAVTDQGVDLKKLAEALQTGSKLDHVMRRKTGYGNQRPLPRVPVGMGAPGGGGA